MEEIKCYMVGMLADGVYENANESTKRVYHENGAAPTITTCGGGNLEPKVAIETDNGEIIVDNKNIRIRKLTEKECFRLMGVKDEDFEKIAKNQSRSSLYHLAGDSIVTNVLMAIFKEML